VGGKPPYDRRNIGFADMIGIADIYPINARTPFGCFNLCLRAKNKKGRENPTF
jgi:hypothetical protein